MYYFMTDIESSGLSVEFNEITEISCLDCQTLEQITWMIRIRRPEKCSKEAMYITNKTPEELMSRGRYIEEVLDEISEFILKGGTEIDEVCVIGHNVVNFDRKFLEYNFSSNGKKFPAIYYLDTLKMSKKYTKDILGIRKTSHKLNDLMITANIKTAETENMHTSATDVRNNFRLWKKMIADGMVNSLFIQMSPAYLAEPNKVENKPIKKKGKKSKPEEYSLDDIMEEQSTEPFFEEDNDD